MSERYDPVYLHEQRLHDAHKKLYMLGHRGRKKTNPLGDLATGGVGAVRGMMDVQKDQQARIAAAQARLQREQAAEREDVENIKGMREESAVKNPMFDDVQYIRYGEYGYPMAKDPYKEMETQADLNSQAAQTPIGGIHTAQSAEAITKNAQEMGHDINVGRSLMQTGGMMNSMVDQNPTVQPPSKLPYQY